MTSPSLAVVNPQTAGSADPEPRRARGRPRAEDLPELEARLIRVARETFLAKGYGATSMNEIARAARVSKGTLYARFPSKAHLFCAIIDQQIRKAGTTAARSGPRPKSLEAALRRYAELALQDSLSAEIVQLNRLIYSEAGRFPELGAAAATRSELGVQQVSAFIADFAARDGVPCRDAAAAAEMFTTLLRGFYGDVMLKGRTASAAQVRAWIDRMLPAFLAGRAGW